ncbi:hypothetical protein [Nocardia fusca]|uniref:Uncharacterized protein n=1 Tax=Nocardia fusca TaxID=941183 RepID=A0ABV3FIK6_9NOCA
MTSKWIMCWACQGDEGEMVDGEWIDCPCCQGEGGRMDGEKWSYTCEPRP